MDNTDHTTPDSACGSPPKTLHGYPVLRAELMPPRTGYQRLYVVLVDRSKDTDPDYIVSDYCVGADEWDQGHYIENRAKADVAFFERCLHWCRH